MGRLERLFAEPLLRPSGCVRASGGRRLGRPLSSARVEVFEDVHGVRLPAAYRTFLVEVGDGGVGPGYGLPPLSPWRSVELPGGLAEVEFGGRVHRAVRVADRGGTEATALLLDGVEAGSLVDFREKGVGAPPRLWPGGDFLSWYAAWLDTVRPVAAEPRSEAVLVGALGGSEAGQRAGAVFELGALPVLSDSTVERLRVLAVRDPSSAVRYQAVEFFGASGVAAVDTLVDAVGDVSRAVGRRALVHVMRLAGATTAWAEALERMRFTSDEVGIRMAEDLEQRRRSGVVLPD
ncbi:hypothetical protein [Saccharothrix australiensis]|uniref:hypothetical protein n=1 Tax=Saccharothrix australiensis TaxID=2072 RepID=UPI0011C43C69|nr:hypothetical protein [Saccharothrix australiensis]